MLPWQLDEISSSFFTLDFMLVNIYFISSNNIFFFNGFSFSELK